MMTTECGSLFSVQSYNNYLIFTFLPMIYPCNRTKINVSSLAVIMSI